MYYDSKAEKKCWTKFQVNNWNLCDFLQVMFKYFDIIEFIWALLYCADKKLMVTISTLAGIPCVIRPYNIIHEQEIWEL